MLSNLSSFVNYYFLGENDKNTSNQSSGSISGSIQSPNTPTLNSSSDYQISVNPSFQLDSTNSLNNINITNNDTDKENKVDEKDVYNSPMLTTCDLKIDSQIWYIDDCGLSLFKETNNLYSPPFECAGYTWKVSLGRSTNEETGNPVSQFYVYPLRKTPN
eukprot:UN29749